MTDYIELQSKHRRLAILRLLKDTPEYTSNASIIYEVCNGVGVPSTRDQIAGEIAWLKENGLVTFEDHSGFIVATATGRGVEVAKGTAFHDGVQRPRPGA